MIFLNSKFITPTVSTFSTFIPEHTTLTDSPLLKKRMKQMRKKDDEDRLRN
jgi:hypothetical protein